MPLKVSPPSVNQMIKTLDKKGLISRQPGQARSLQILVPEDQIPKWDIRKSRKPPLKPSSHFQTTISSAPSEKLYQLLVFLTEGPLSEKMANQEISRTIEIRGDQTLEDLHVAIFKAYDRWEEHLYEFQFGDRPFDPEGQNYGIPFNGSDTSETGNAQTTTLDSLNLKTGRFFGYWFDFGDDWYHQIEVEQIEKVNPKRTYPRITQRVGPSPPQYKDEE